MNSILRDLAAVIQAGLFKPEPYQGSETVGVFRSHCDWHSSVLAHWSLLGIARALGDRDLRALILQRLTVPALKQECETLRSDPAFEMPYGQSWLLLLLTERAKVHASPELAPLHRELADRLCNWLEDTPFPDGTDGRCRGEYDSWSFTYFRLKYSQVDAERLRNLEQKFSKVVDVRDDGNPRAFVSSAAVGEVLRGSIASDSGIVGILQNFGPVTFANCHGAGYVVSKSWPSAAAAGRGGELELSDFMAQLKILFDKQELWKQDYATVSHWVPQYLWIGIWLALGSP